MLSLGFIERNCEEKLEIVISGDGVVRGFTKTLKTWKSPGYIASQIADTRQLKSM